MNYLDLFLHSLRTMSVFRKRVILISFIYLAIFFYFFFKKNIKVYILIILLFLLLNLILNFIYLYFEKSKPKNLLDLIENYKNY